VKIKMAGWNSAQFRNDVLNGLSSDERAVVGSFAKVFSMCFAMTDEGVAPAILPGILADASNAYRSYAAGRAPDAVDPALSDLYSKIQEVEEMVRPCATGLTPPTPAHARLLDIWEDTHTLMVSLLLRPDDKVAEYGDKAAILSGVLVESFNAYKQGERSNDNETGVAFTNQYASLLGFLNNVRRKALQRDAGLILQRLRA